MSYRFLIYLNAILILFILDCDLCANNTIQSAPLKRVHRLKDIPQNDAQCLFKDSKGFIWIGTLDGLLRYDGYTYKIYRTNKSGNCICSNLIISIGEDSYGNIWIGTYGSGICKLNPVTEQFTSFNNKDDEIENKIDNDISVLVVDHNNVIWLGSWFGVSRVLFDEEMNIVKDVENVLTAEIKSIFEDKDNQIWFGENGNLYRIINPYGSPDKIEYEIFEASAAAICQYEDDILIGGASLSVVARDQSSPVAKYNVTQFYEVYLDNVVYSNRSIWCGSRNGVLVLEQREDCSWKVANTYSNDSSDDSSIGNNIVTALIADDNGQVWVGTRGGGVSTIRQNPKKFERYKHTQHPGSLSNDFTRSVYVDHSDNLWIGSEEGGVSLLRNSEKNNYKTGFQHIRINSRLSENRVYAIKELMTPKSNKHKSLIYMGTSYSTNLATVDPVSLEVKPSTMGDSNVGFVFSLEVENDSTLWAGTYYNGLWKFITNDDGEIIKNYHFSPTSPNGSSITSFIIRSVFKDSEGNLWIGTDKGLNLIKASELVKEYPQIEKFTMGDQEQSLPYNYLLKPFQAKNGKIWIGTMGGGLIGVEKDKSTGKYSFIRG